MNGRTVKRLNLSNERNSVADNNSTLFDACLGFKIATATNSRKVASKLESKFWILCLPIDHVEFYVKSSRASGIQTLEVTMAGPLLRVPSLRYLITLIALLTTVHYFLSYTSPTYASNTAYFPSRRPQTDGTRQERLGKETSGEDWELSASSPDWSSDNESGRPINETVGGRRANAAYVILARNSDVWEIVESIRGMEGKEL